LLVWYAVLAALRRCWTLVKLRLTAARSEITRVNSTARCTVVVSASGANLPRAKATVGLDRGTSSSPARTETTAIALKASASARGSLLVLEPGMRGRFGGVENGWG